MVIGSRKWGRAYCRLATTGLASMIQQMHYIAGMSRHQGRRMRLQNISFIILWEQRPLLFIQGEFIVVWGTGNVLRQLDIKDLGSIYPFAVEMSHTAIVSWASAE
jgi:hypothetical protein